MKKIVLVALVSVLLLLTSLANYMASVKGTFTEKPKLYVEPAENIGVPIFSEFTVNVSIANVIDCVSFEFKLSYNNTILEATEAFIPEGHFLTPEIGTFLPIDSGTIHQDEGYVSFAATVLYPEPGKNGSGTFATITFKAMGFGEGNLTLYDTIVMNSAVEDIEHDLGHRYFITLFHDVAITDVKPSDFEVILGETINITVSVKNKGSETETFNVTVYYDDIAIGRQEITLLIKEDTEIFYSWDTTGILWGNHTIKAEAEVVPDEIQTDDNTYIDGTVRVLSPPTAIFTYERIGLVNNMTLLSFNALNSYDPDGRIMNYAWDFGDGTPVFVGADPVVAHNYTEIGTCNVTLITTDNDGLTDSTTTTVNIGVLPGDLNDDGKVDIRDITIVALAFGSKPGDENWNVIADLNDDEVIDIRDITIVAMEFGKTV